MGVMHTFATALPIPPAALNGVQLSDLFANSFVGRRDAVALECEAPDGQLLRLTFGEIDARANRMAHVLSDRGLVTGNRLCVWLANRVEFIDLFLACTRLGVIFVPINVLYREREIAHIVVDSGPAAVVTAGDEGTLFPPGTTIWDVGQLSTEAAAIDRPAVTHALDGDLPALLIYTSGTTGRSKGAVLSHNNLLANALTLASAWQVTAADRFLCALPLFHVHGLGNGIITWLISGCRMRLVERFEAARAAGWFRDFGPTLFFGVPTIYVRLLELPDATAQAIGAGMRLFVSGSAPLPTSILEAFRSSFGHTILERYGMSETLMICSNPLFGERRPGSVGFPLPGVSLRIVSPTGDERAPGAVGEVWVKGPAVCRGYWRRPDADSDAFVEGWFRTGDLAERAEDGYITLRGRSTDLIIAGGFNIYPREIEEVLLEQPGIREAVVVGAPDAARGEVPVAYVVSDRPLDPAALDAACRAQLASFKVPRAFVPVDALPRTALGKVQRHLLPPWR
jgi:malonyl-CoA/methylmalonyl-CoA synthetase